jgi:hypothetical protein
VTDVGVGSGALLGSGASIKRHIRKAGEKRGKTRDLIFREAVAIARMVEHALTHRLLPVLRRRQKTTVVHARTVSQLHSDFPSLALPARLSEDKCGRIPIYGRFASYLSNSSKCALPGALDCNPA